MARTLAQLPPGSRITDYISLGVLARRFPRSTVDRVLRQSGRADRRQRDLPAPVMVYYVIALALYMQVSYREVWRCLLEGLSWRRAAPRTARRGQPLGHLAGPYPAGGRAAAPIARRARAADRGPRQPRQLVRGAAAGLARRQRSRPRR